MGFCQLHVNLDLEGTSLRVSDLDSPLFTANDDDELRCMLVDMFSIWFSWSHSSWALRWFDSSHDESDADDDVVEHDDERTNESQTFNSNSI